MALLYIKQEVGHTKQLHIDYILLGGFDCHGDNARFVFSPVMDQHGPSPVGYYQRSNPERG